jgi:sulfur relay (sulfurtransferase) DsrC/TusE family protein
MEDNNSDDEALIKISDNYIQEGDNNKESIETHFHMENNYDMGTKEMEIIKKLNSITNPEFVSEKIQELVQLVEQMNFSERDDNALIYQLISNVEARLTKRIADLREEVYEKLYR